MITVRRAEWKELGEYGTHLKSLNETSKRTRFGSYVDDSTIDKLIVSMIYENEKHQLWVAETGLEKIGWGHMAEDHANAWEIAVSVENNYQGEGIGSRLVGKMLSWAKTHQVDEIYMHCVAENQAIRAIAEKFKLRTVDRNYGEITAALEVPSPTILEVGTERLDENITLLQNIMDMQRQLWKNISGIK